MERHGVESSFFILPGSFSQKSPERVSKEIESWFGCDFSVFVSAEIPEQFDAVVATAWNTALFASRQKCPHKFYFIQDYEPWFSPMGEGYLLAEQSYGLRLKPITIGRWLADKVSPHYEDVVPFCDFGADLSVYRPFDAVERIPNSVCAVYQPEKDRRLSGVLRDAIKLLIAADENIQIFLYGGDCTEFGSYSRVHALGILTVEECAALYSKCSLGISISASNPSRIPFEMMASGLPVVEIARENNFYDLPLGAITFAVPSPEGIASAVVSALANPSNLHTRAEAGRLFMQDRSINNENEMFYKAIIDYMDPTERPICELGGHAEPESAPIAKSLSILQGKLQFSRWNDCAKAQTPVFARKIEFEVQAPNFDVEVLKVACWARSDQSDITWTPLNQVRGGIWRCSVSLQSGLVEALFLMHLYLFDAEESKSLFVGAIEQLVTTIVPEGATSATRDCELNGYKVGVQFCVAADSASSEESPKDQIEHLSFAQKVFRRIKGNS